MIAIHGVTVPTIAGSDIAGPDFAAFGNGVSGICVRILFGRQ